MYFHLLSTCVLIFTVCFVIKKCFNMVKVSERIFWSFFLLTTLFLTTTELFQILGMGNWAQVQHYLLNLRAVGGGVGLIIGAWCLMSDTDVKPLVAVLIMAAALVLFIAVIKFQSGIMSIIMLPVCIIFVLVVACWGLLRRQRSGLWLVFAMMFLALSLKKMSIPLDSGFVEINHYLTSLSVLFLGYAIRNRSVVLFR
jgi:hypothetical protein